MFDLKEDDEDNMQGEFFWHFITWDMLFPWVGLFITGITAWLFERDKTTVFTIGCIISIIICIARASSGRHGLSGVPQTNQSGKLIFAISILLLLIFETITSLAFITNIQNRTAIITIAIAYVAYLTTSYISQTAFYLRPEQTKRKALSEKRFDER